MRFALTVSLLIASAPCMAQIMTGGTAVFGGMVSQTNNPVSLVFEHKQTQTLADGTHITTIRHEYFYRDSLGRTRNENEFPIYGVDDGAHARSVNVWDPVAGTHTNWMVGDPNGGPHQFNRTDQNAQQRPMMTTQNVNQSHTTVPMPRQQISARPMPKTTTEQLGLQDVQGLPCEAIRMTVVYPVDFLGNDRPITTVSEHCQSREFGRMLRDSSEDPRSGTQTATLQSASRGEPDPSLFQPPPDYVDARTVSR